MNKQPHITVNTAIVTRPQLQSVGIELSDEQEAQALIDHITDTINERIGEEVIEQLDDNQLEELVTLQSDGATGEEIDAFIRQNVPEYDEIIEDNVAIVLGELVKNSDAISQ